MRTSASIFIQESFYKGSSLESYIQVIRADIINGKITPTEQIGYGGAIITKIEAAAINEEGQTLNTLKFWFRFLKRTDFMWFFDQNGQPQGKTSSFIDFTKGQLGQIGRAHV